MSLACLALRGLATLYLEVTSIPTGCICTYSHIAYPKIYTANRTDSSHWESSPGNEAYQRALEEVNALAKMLVLTTIV